MLAPLMYAAIMPNGPHLTQAVEASLGADQVAGGTDTFLINQCQSLRSLQRDWNHMGLWSSSPGHQWKDVYKSKLIACMTGQQIMTCYIIKIMECQYILAKCFLLKASWSFQSDLLLFLHYCVVKLMAVILIYYNDTAITSLEQIKQIGQHFLWLDQHQPLHCPFLEREWLKDFLPVYPGDN